jgi:hypothetical protein
MSTLAGKATTASSTPQNAEPVADQPGRPAPAADKPKGAGRQWLAQILPAAALAWFGYQLHGLIAVVYQTFYEKLGATTTEAGYDPASGMGTLVALDGLTVIFVLAILLPVVSGVLAVYGLKRDPGTNRTVVLASMVPAVLVAVAHAPDDRQIRLLMAFAAVSAAVGIALGFAMSMIAPVTVLLPLGTVLVSAVTVKGLIAVVHREVAVDATFAFLALLAFGVLKLQRQLTSPARPLTKAIGLHWPASPVRQSAITFAGVALLALGGVWDLYHLDAAAGRAADQVRAYGYITDAPDDLDLTVRPITVRLLTSQDPLGICSPTLPVALTQLNRTSGDALVLVRPLIPTSLTPVNDPDLTTMWLPASQYAVVQHLQLWNQPKTPTRPPDPWAVAACAPAR